MSGVFHYTRPHQEIAVPSNVKWSDIGVVSWAVDHVKLYVAYLYKVIDGNDNLQDFKDSIYY